MSSKISIVVPVYNREDFLENCVNSLLAQSYSNIEIVLVNDGSKDNSAKICDNIANKNENIKVIHTDNRGVSSARNTGIENSSGEYILFVDPDDTIDSSMCEELYKLAKRDNDKLSICGIKLTNMKNEVIKNVDFNSVSLKKYFLLEEKSYLKLFTMDLLNSPCNKLFDKKIIDDKNLRFENGLALGEDMFFVTNYLRYVNGFSVVNRCLYNYLQIGTGTLSVKAYKNMYEIQQNIFSRLINLLDGIKLFEEDIDIIKTIYYTIVWRSIRNLIRKSEEFTLAFKIKEFYRIISSSRNIELNIDGENRIIKLIDINSIFWYIKFKLTK